MNINNPFEITTGTILSGFTFVAGLLIKRAAKLDKKISNNQIAMNQLTASNIVMVNECDRALKIAGKMSDLVS